MRQLHSLLWIGGLFMTTVISGVTFFWNFQSTSEEYLVQTLAIIGMLPSTMGFIFYDVENMLTKENAFVDQKEFKAFKRKDILRLALPMVAYISFELIFFTKKESLPENKLWYIIPAIAIIILCYVYGFSRSRKRKNVLTLSPKT